MITSAFLLSTVTMFAVVYALPLLLAPLAWARLFRWRIADDVHLTRYFGRCLGAAALALLYVIGAGAFDPQLAPTSLEVAAVAGGLLGAVHVVGALEKSQPWTETAEIALYVAATAIAIVLRLHPM